MEPQKLIAMNTKEIRERKKLTLDAAAKLTGVSRSMLAQIEKGDVNPTVSVLWKLANGYKVSFTSLVDNHAEPELLIRAGARHWQNSFGPFLSDDVTIKVGFQLGRRRNVLRLLFTVPLFLFR